MEQLLRFVANFLQSRNLDRLRDDVETRAKRATVAARERYRQGRKELERHADLFQHKRSKSSRVPSLLAGMGIGLGLGLLFAPADGKTTRRRVRDAMQEFRGARREGNEADGGTESQRRDQWVGGMSRKAIDLQADSEQQAPRAI
ncbi:MAG TPA: hypothetical protein VFA76_08245 [Terriglobales bacterium]|nr:hypothetical protein [Terriglobales bacterium]